MSSSTPEPEPDDIPLRSRLPDHTHGRGIGDGVSQPVGTEDALDTPLDADADSPDTPD